MVAGIFVAAIADGIGTIVGIELLEVEAPVLALVARFDNDFARVDLDFGIGVIFDANAKNRKALFLVSTLYNS